MKSIFTVSILFFFILCTPSAAISSMMHRDSLRFELLLNQKVLNKLNISESFIPSLDITPTNHILLSSSSQFYVLGWGGMAPFGQKTTGGITAFAFTPYRFLMTVRKDELCSFDSTGALIKLLKLPHESMGVSYGKKTMYVYDQQKGLDKNALYVIAIGHRYARLFDVPKPIRAVAELNDSLLFATQNAIFSFNPVNQEVHAIAVLPENQEITSIAIDSVEKRIYFATAGAVFSLKGSKASVVTNEMGGILSFFNGGLIVFNPEKKYVIRILGLEKVLESK